MGTFKSYITPLPDFTCQLSWRSGYFVSLLRVSPFISCEGHLRLWALYDKQETTFSHGSAPLFVLVACLFGIRIFNGWWPLIPPLLFWLTVSVINRPAFVLNFTRMVLYFSRKIQRSEQVSALLILIAS